MYKPTVAVDEVLSRAWRYIVSVPYAVTARWVFYRLLQDGIFNKKADYKRLLGYLSKARKGFYKRWRPDTLADDTRAPLLMEREGLYKIHMRGQGFHSYDDWLRRLQAELNIPLDRWRDQPAYVEVWFEAAAMMSQFRFYANENIPLLAFHGDISIPEKWRATRRLVQRWRELEVPMRVLYYGDLDPKGEQIPESARADIVRFAAWVLAEGDKGRSSEELEEEYFAFLDAFELIRVGLNADHPALYNIPENPERPGTYQWEGLDDASAQALIGEANQYLNLAAFAQIEEQERGITERFQGHLNQLDLSKEV